MLFKTHYKSDLDKNLGHNKKNILSFRNDIVKNEIPIIELGWGFIWILIKHKLKHKVYMLVLSTIHESILYDFFYINKKK